MKHKVAQLKTEITINQIKVQREQRRKNKKQNNSLILHNARSLQENNAHSAANQSGRTIVAI